ncbi:MAG TPA: hypothetical protein VHX36_01170 [Candidatus Acidoferrales bacterium]|nr:hypothetical protein [Candidatus Acidoferrales bacterium]
MTQAPDRALDSTNSRQPQSALAQSARFVRHYWRRMLAISALVLVPCYWHRRIEASDLGSHVYNAWLAQLIRHGDAPGLRIAHQWTNVLFDFLLNFFGSIFGLGGHWHLAEKFSVSLCVLIFFWGAFALIGAATHRAPWFIAPVIALITYGYTFRMGFFNYYLAIGLSFFALAIFWRGRGGERLLGVAIAPLVFLAHAIGFLWLAGAAIYIALAERFPRRRQFLLLLPATLLLALHEYFWKHYIVEAAPHSLLWFSGADQLILYGDRYWICAGGLIAFVLISIAIDWIGRWRARAPGREFDHGVEGGADHDVDHRDARAFGIPLQLYVVALLAVPLLPRGVYVSHTVPIALLTDRLTSVSAILVCCLLGAMRPSRWHLAASAIIAAIFFTFVYQDTSVANRMEAQAERLVHTLPRNSRVMATIDPPIESRILIQHMIDRACIGYCFSYGNYEPSTGVFRVRSTPGNPYVLNDYQQAIDMEDGDYSVQPQDLPVYQVYQCDDTGTVLCIRPLAAGEDNDESGVHPAQQ